MKVVIGFCILTVVFAKQERCHDHQAYNECGTYCPLTCENYRDPPQVCGLACVPGCHCDDGYVLTKDKRCVKKEECPVKTTKTRDDTADRDRNKFCLVRSDSGRCRGNFPKWYYSAQTATCRMFVYGGCQGNSNRYDTEQECLHRCKGVKSTKSSSSVCRLPAETGRCLSYFERFYFDAISGQCKMFIYSGCMGNRNNFRSLQECKRTCNGHAFLVDV